MLTLRLPHPPLPPLRLNFYPQRLRLDSQNGSTALKHTLIDVRRPLHSVVAATEYTGPVKTKHVTGLNARHAERQTNLVAFLDEVGEPVDVHGDVMAWLSGKERQQVLD